MRLVVLTNREFYDLAIRRTEGKLARNTQIWHCPLTPALEQLVNRVCREASNEIDLGKVRVRTQTTDQ